MSKNCILLLFAFLVWMDMRSANASDIHWGESQWIGYTEDDRPAQWSARDVTFNAPRIWSFPKTENSL